jgi:DnaJ-class molecular chaperone
MCRIIIGPCDACGGEGKIAVRWPGDAHEFVGKCETCNGEGWMLDVAAQCDGQQPVQLISTADFWEIFTEDRPWP